MPDVASAPRKPLVLIVEDQAIIRLDLSEALSRNGFRVAEAADGEAALALLDEDAPVAAAILDINLPGRLTGYDLVREVRQREPGATVVIISGRDFVMPADFSEHVIVESKPLDLQKIALVLRMRHAEGI